MRQLGLYAVVIAALVCGCSQNQPAASAPDQAAEEKPVTLEELFGEVNELLSQERVAAAIELLEEAWLREEMA